MATHSSILTWKIPWRGEPGGFSPWGHKELNTTEQLTITEAEKKAESAERAFE